jgi:uncharacterized repeat protein (TIGR02543 family)
MFGARAAASGTQRIEWARRAGAGVLALAAAVAFGVVLGPVSVARADVAVNSVTDLALAFSTQASGSTITLNGDATGDSNSPAVAVPTGVTLTLDLSGHQLTLVGGNGAAGIGVPAGAILTIIDSAPGGAVGILNATGDIGGAGIGGGNGESGGAITINGGTITTTGAFAGAGIGGGWYGAGGTITINGGTITATAGDMAAGIGGGHSGNGGTIAINGGTVIASSSTDGAAIGGGVSAAGASVSIGVGAEVTVSASESVIGAGGSGPSFGSLSNAGTLNIPFLNILYIPAGFTVTNSGTIRNNGLITDDGTVTNSGTILNNNTIVTPANVTGHNTTVVLDGNGGTAPGDPAVVYSGTFQNGQIAFPAVATRTGRTFTGWFTQPAGGTQVTSSTDLGLGGPKSMTLYAQWNESVPADNGSATLAATGSDPLPIGLIGSLLTIAGLALYLRRRHVTVD